MLRFCDYPPCSQSIWTTMILNILIVARRPCSDRWITHEYCTNSSMTTFSLPVSRVYSEDVEYMEILESSSKRTHLLFWQAALPSTALIVKCIPLFSMVWATDNCAQ